MGKQIAECKNDRAKDMAQCKKDQMKCESDTNDIKNKMNAYKQKAKEATDLREAADRAFKKMATQVRVIDKKISKCHEDKQKREAYHIKRLKKMRMKHHKAKTKHDACKKN